MYNSTAKIDRQEILNDLSATGRVRPWREHKLHNQLLASAYLDVNRAKAERLQDCATKLVFAVDSGNKHLIQANFCRVRLCPVCAWRRSLKAFVQTRRVMDAITVDQEYAYLFVTLTVRNVEGDQLSDTITGLMRGWRNLIYAAQVKRAVKGYYRGLEVTHNVDAESPSYNTYHPHFHCIFAVNKRYFNGQGYIKQKDWIALWRRAMRLDYDPVVDVRRVKGCTAEAVAEAAKYAVKAEDYIIPDDWDLTVDTVRVLDEALAKRRLIAYGGVMGEYHRKLNLDDPDEGDLVHVGEDNLGGVDLNRVIYIWHTGYKQYFRCK